MVINEAVSGLLLDERNPRFPEQVSGQDEAVTAMLVDAAPKLVNLAQDVANEGSLNPTELPVVVEEDGELVVVEGNRRLAALKLLRNPDLATAASEQLGTELVKRFKTLQQIGVGPDSIDVFQAESREAARHWIELRHTGENDGVGVLGWQAWQTNNYVAGEVVRPTGDAVLRGCRDRLCRGCLPAERCFRCAPESAHYSRSLGRGPRCATRFRVPP